MYDFAAGASSETKEFVYNTKGNHKDDLLSKITQFDCHKANIKVPYFAKPVNSFIAFIF